MATVFLAGNNQMILPNSPRESKHKIISLKKNQAYLYYIESLYRKIWRPLEGMSIIKPLFENFDLIHAFNSIPITKKPWIITFESILPRTIGSGGEKFELLIRHKLLSENCLKLIAMSDYAKTKFLLRHNDWNELEVLIKKLDVILPTFPLKTKKVKTYKKGQILELIFIGNDFARKGGIVALRVAKKAHKLGLPIKLHIISKMNMGSRVYTDCVDSNHYLKDLKSLALDNIIFHDKISNYDVINLLLNSHIQVMCTLDDTFGFSILEGFSVGTPAITTNVCALPEVVNQENGHMISLELDNLRNWIHLKRRNNKNYWDILDETFNNMSDSVLNIISQIIDNPKEYQKLSAGALSSALVHNSAKSNTYFDIIYSDLALSLLKI